MVKQITEKQRGSSEGRARRLANLKPFKQGRSGNPGGRPRGVLSAPAVIRRRWHEKNPDDPEGRTWFEMAVDELKVKAAAGDVVAFKELYDRLEGKARQSVTLTLDQRDRFERMVDNLIESELREGRNVSRDEAIEALAVVEPLVSELLN